HITLSSLDATFASVGYTASYSCTEHNAPATATRLIYLHPLHHALLDLGHTDAPGGKAGWSFAGNNNYNPASGEVDITLSAIDATFAIVDYTGSYDGTEHIASGTATGLNDLDLSGLLSFGAGHTNAPGGK